MKINKVNLAFGTLVCAATLSSMMMAHSSMVYADANNSNTQGVAAMQFDEDVQNVENNDVQTRQVAQTKNMTNQSAQPQNVDTVERERERDSRLISTVRSVDENGQRRTDNIVHETVQRPAKSIGQNESDQNHVLFNHVNNDHINVHYVDLNGKDIKNDNVQDSLIKYDNWGDDRRKYSVPDGYLIGDGLNKRKQDFDIVQYKTLGGGVKYNDPNDIRHSDLNLNYEMSNRLYNAIKDDPKSKTLLFNWDKINSYDDFQQYIGRSFNNNYYLTLGFPTEVKNQDSYRRTYTDLVNRKPENLCVVGWNDYYDDKLNDRFANEQFRINISQHDPELAKYIYNTVMSTVDKNIINGSVDIGHDKLENADGTLHITLNVDSPSEYTYTDLTGLAKVDKKRANTIDVPIIKRDATAQGQLITATRTIKFNFPDNKVPLVYRRICNSDGVIKQTVHFWKDPIVDEITGLSVPGYYGDWTPVVSTGYYGKNAWRKDTSKYAGQFPPITFPRVPGFTLHINKA